MSELSIGRYHLLTRGVGLGIYSDFQILNGTLSRIHSEFVFFSKVANISDFLEVAVVVIHEKNALAYRYKKLKIFEKL